MPVPARPGMRAAALALGLAAIGCATPNPPAPPAPAGIAAPPAQLDVDVALLPDEAGRVGGVALRYCPRAGAPWPRRLTAENRRALPFLVSAVDDAGRALAVDSDGIATRGLAGGCARLVVDVGRLADTLADRDLAFRAGDDLIITPDLWLWRPEPFDDGTRLFVRVDAGGKARFDALLPWTPGGDGRAAVDGSTWALKSDAAFGRFDVDEVNAAGARFMIARLDDGRAPPKLDQWIAASANAVATVMGRYPLPRVNVLVVPTEEKAPIVVGFFSRGGGPTATFFVGEGAGDIDDDDLDATRRWTITHELSHPLLPPVQVQDAWLNEGLATWHQDLLARRAGMLKDDEAYWGELVRGLKTGAARAAEDRLSLDDASAHMHEDGAYQHAYWAGVAVMLLAEVAAQQRGASLDDVVRALRARFPDDRPRSARELLTTLSAGTNAQAATAAQVLLATFEAHKAEAFPPTEEVLSRLGVSVDAVGGVHLDDGAPLAAVRRAITQGSASTTAAVAAAPR